MKNAFNECHRVSFLQRVQKDFPEVPAWVQWCYHCAGELRFGQHHIASTASVQQGDLLGPFLFSLVFANLLDNIGDVPGIITQLWYLDDGTFVGSRHAASTFLNSLDQNGPAFGIHLKINK